MQYSYNGNRIAYRHDLYDIHENSGVSQIKYRLNLSIKFEVHFQKFKQDYKATGQRFNEV